MHFLPSIKKLIQIYRITGQSMAPVLRDGDYVIASSMRKLKRGRFVVASHPDYPVLVKEVLEVGGDGGFKLRGLNSASLSSEQMGWLAPEQLLGVVLATVKQ